MVPTLVTCPTFSASSTRITGRKIGSRVTFTVGVWNSGSPSQAASWYAVKSTSWRLHANRYPMITPTSTLIRPISPLNRAVHATTDTSVTTAVSGAFEKLFWYVVGTRFRPMSATIEPITTGGMRWEIQPAPTFCTTRPSRASSSPVTSTPPSAAPIESACVEAVIGAMNAKEEPR